VTYDSFYFGSAVSSALKHYEFQQNTDINW